MKLNSNMISERATKVLLATYSLDTENLPVSFSISIIILQGRGDGNLLIPKTH